MKKIHNHTTETANIPLSCNGVCGMDSSQHKDCKSNMWRIASAERNRHVTKTSAHRPNKTESAVGEEDVASPQSPTPVHWLYVYLSQQPSNTTESEQQRRPCVSVSRSRPINSSLPIPQATHWSTTANDTNTLPTISRLLAWYRWPSTCSKIT